MPDLSVIIPAYNEERRLPTTLQSIHEFLSNSGMSFEILVVDDGSIDHTAAVVETYGQHNDQVRLLCYSPNQGKGYAVRTGIMAAHGNLLLIADADGAAPISELPRLEQAIAGGADIAIGSRAKADPTRTVKALFYRRYMGNTFNFIVQSLLLKGIQDTQCGFKLFKRSAARDIFSVARMNGYGFDVEILHIARLRSYKIAEIAVDWTEIDGSKVNVLVDSPKMLFEVLEVAFGSALGQYRQLPNKSQEISTKKLQD